VELLAVILMFITGGAIAIVVMIATAIARREAERSGGGSQRAIPERDRIASSLLFHIVMLGGVSSDVAMREVRRASGIAAPITSGIDITNWGESYARMSTPEQRASLLEIAVQLVASRGALVPLRQYVALLDLSFALGFQTDALAKLREQYGFDYVDHAKDGRPREADRGAGRVTFFDRGGDERELLRVLQIEGPATRAMIISAYRKLVAQHHPDKFHSKTREEQDVAAARFIEITRAYEALLVLHRD
jgi:DnaJ-domain-containing protein 1